MQVQCKPGVVANLCAPDGRLHRGNHLSAAGGGRVLVYCFDRQPHLPGKGGIRQAGKQMRSRCTWCMFMHVYGP